MTWLQTVYDTLVMPNLFAVAVTCLASSRCHRLSKDGASQSRPGKVKLAVLGSYQSTPSSEKKGSKKFSELSIPAMTR